MLDNYCEISGLARQILNLYIKGYAAGDRAYRMQRAAGVLRLLVVCCSKAGGHLHIECVV